MLGSGGLAQGMFYAKKVFFLETQHLLISLQGETGTKSAESHHRMGWSQQEANQPMWYKGNMGYLKFVRLIECSAALQLIIPVSSGGKCFMSSKQNLNSSETVATVLNLILMSQLLGKAQN